MIRLNIIKMLSISIVLAIVLSSCGGDKKGDGADDKLLYFDTLFVICEHTMKDMMQSPFEGFIKAHPGIILDVEYGTSLDCMKARLGNTKDASIVSRDFTPQENALAMQYKVPYVENPLAQDGLVFFVKKDSPLDSMNVTQVKEWLLNPYYMLSEQFPKLSSEPRLATLGAQSSIYTNLSLVCCDSLQVTRPVKPLENVEQVKDFVRENDNVIGTCYLSHLEGDSTLRAIRIGYHHKDGNREMPQIVHMSWIIQNRYPYEVNYDVLTRPNLPGRNKTMRFLNYVVLNRGIQQEFFDKGIIPEHARFELIKED